MTYVIVKDGKYLSQLAPVAFDSVDVSASYRYNSEQIAKDIANQLGAEVLAIGCASRAGLDELAAIILHGAVVEIQGEPLLDERLRRARLLHASEGWAGKAPLTDLWLSKEVRGDE
jgi:hypothetical protein